MAVERQLVYDPILAICVKEKLSDIFAFTVLAQQTHFRELLDKWNFSSLRIREVFIFSFEVAHDPLKYCCIKLKVCPNILLWDCLCIKKGGSKAQLAYDEKFLEMFCHGQDPWWNPACKNNSQLFGNEIKSATEGDYSTVRGWIFEAEAVHSQPK